MQEQRDLIQEALREGETQLRALLDDAMVAVHLKDPQGWCLMLNRWAEMTLRVARQEVLGKTDHELFPKEVVDALRANALEGLDAKAPVRMVTSLGSASLRERAVGKHDSLPRDPE